MPFELPSPLMRTANLERDEDASWARHASLLPQVGDGVDHEIRYAAAVNVFAMLSRI